MRGVQRILSVAAISTLTLAAGCKRAESAKGGSGRVQPGQNVLFITLDTTRADRIGCYGYEKARTPTLDALAARGTLFDNAFSQVPLTLPSHTSIMTGRYPREHGIRDNARNGLGPELPTLAGIFKEKGYRTGAFVASFVLDSRFGLDRGFDVYNDDMNEAGFEKQALEWEQPANVITDRALSWLGGDQDSPFFAWLHYYDPHDPYTPPAEYMDLGIGPYNAEIAFVDAQLARVMKWLEDAKLADRTLVVVVADHGESLGEHEVTGHTNFLYWTHIHVPLIVACAGAVPAGKRVTSVVETVDLFPTLLDMMGWSAPAGMLSRSLAPAFAGDDFESGAAYSESLYVYNAFGWAEQRALTTSRWAYMSSTRPELFDRRNDPKQLASVAATNPKSAAGMLEALQDRYGQMTPGKAAEAPLDERGRQAMESLGYAGSASGTANGLDAFLTDGLTDPKDMRGVLNRFKAAKLLMDKAKTPDDYKLAAPLLASIVAESPESMMFQHMLGHCYLRSGDAASAITALEAARKLDGGFAPVAAALGDAHTLVGNAEEAIRHYEASLRLDPNSADVHTKLGDLLAGSGRRTEALDHYRRAIALMPKLAAAHIRIGELLSEDRQFDEVVRHYRAALAVQPEDDGTHYNLGVVYSELGDLASAEREFREAIRRNAENGDAYLNLGTTLVRLGRPGDVEAAMEPALSLPAVAAKAHYTVGVAMARLGRLDQTIRLYERAIELDPCYVAAIEELTGYLLSQRRTGDAVRVFRLSVKSGCDDPRVLHSLAKLLATSSNPSLRNGSEAVDLCARLLRKHGADPVLLQTYAAALAESGRFAEAIEEARRASGIAERAGPAGLADAIREQIEGYQADRAYHDPRF